MADTKAILEALAPHAILVGSAARGDDYRDIDLVVGAKGLSLAKKVFPAGWESAFLGSITTFETEPAIEVFRWWHGPDYAALKRRKDLVKRTIMGVEFRAWPKDTRADG